MADEPKHVQPSKVSPDRAPKRAQLSNDKQIQSLKAEGVPYEHAIKGGKGLRIKVAATGKRAWYYRYRNRASGALERIKIGDAPPMTLAQAREEAATQRSVVKTHGSAKQHRDAELKRHAAIDAEALAEQEQSSYTVAKLIDEYVDEASRTLKSWREVDRCLRVYVLPALGDRPANAVTRRDVIAMLDPLSKAGKLVQANRVLAYLRKAFSWAVRQDKVPTNPCVDIDKHKERARERFLGDTEISRVLANLPSGLHETGADVLRLVLLTGLRLGEALGMRYDMIDGDTLSLSNTKNGTTHHVYLSPQALALIKRRQGASAFVFPLQTDLKRPFRQDRLQHELQKAIPRLKVMPFTAHDLRRSFATGIARLKCPRLLISLALNHTIPGITSRYDKHSYETELREWWATWGAHISRLGPQDTQKREEAA